MQKNGDTNTSQERPTEQAKSPIPNVESNKQHPSEIAISTVKVSNEPPSLSMGAQIIIQGSKREEPVAPPARASHDGVVKLSQESQQNKPTNGSSSETGKD